MIDHYRTMRRPVYHGEGRIFEADSSHSILGAAAAGHVRLEALVHGHYPGRKLPRHTLPGVKMIGFWDAVSDQDWGLDWHHNEGIGLTFLESGRLEFGVDGRRFELHANDLTVTRPWQAHRVGNPYVGASRLHFLLLDVGVRRPHQPWHWPAWLILTKPDREELTGYLRQNEKPVWPATPEVAQCFRRIAHAVETDVAGSRVSQSAVLLNELFLLLLGMFRSQGVALDRSLTSTQRTVRLFWQTMHGNAEQLALDWTVGRMARRCGLGVTRFTHCTKELVNMTPGQYLTQCRVHVAAEMLTSSPELSITQVAAACGFCSGQYFATLFRQFHGLAPKRYRVEHRAGEPPK